MSVPKSIMLSTRPNVSFNTDVKINSPNQTQSQVVNINIDDTMKVSNEAVNNLACESVYYPESSPINTTDHTDCSNSLNKTIKAMSIIIEILENNPPIKNKYKILNRDQLTKLIAILTDSSTEDVSLLIKKKYMSRYDKIKSINIYHNGMIQNIKYSYPDVVQLFEERMISMKLLY